MIISASLFVKLFDRTSNFPVSLDGAPWTVISYSVSIRGMDPFVGRRLQVIFQVDASVARYAKSHPVKPPLQLGPILIPRPFSAQEDDVINTILKLPANIILFKVFMSLSQL